MITIPSSLLIMISLVIVAQEHTAGSAPLRIALVTETFPPEVNGVAMTLGRLVEGLEQFGHSVQVVRPRQPMIDDRRRGTSDRILRPGLPLPGYAGLQLGLPCRTSLLARWRRNRPDVIHVATEGPMGVSALGAADRLGIPVTSTYHTNFDQYSGHYGWVGVHDLVAAWMRRFHNRTRVTLVPTVKQRDALRAAGYRNVDVLSRGVDTELFHPGRRDPGLRAEWGVSDSDPVLVYLGRLAAEKNLATTVAAFDAVRARVPTARLVMIGDGPERQRYADHAGVIQVGMQRGEQLARHLASCDLFPFASTTETFGNVVTEAMACGVAVVANDYAAAHERIAHGRDGWLVPFGDDRALVEATAVLGADADRRRMLASAAPKAVGNCSWHAICATFEDHLLSAVGRPRVHEAVTCG